MQVDCERQTQKLEWGVGCMPVAQLYGSSQPDKGLTPCLASSPCVVVSVCPCYAVWPCLFLWLSNILLLFDYAPWMELASFPLHGPGIMLCMFVNWGPLSVLGPLLHGYWARRSYCLF